MAGGDADAMTELVRRTAPAALAAARRITGDEALAEDAAQDAYLKVFRALRGDRYLPRVRFRAWLRTIAVRCAIDVVRRRGRLRESPAPDSLPARCELTRHEDADLLGAALRALSPLDREMLLAREYEGASDREIARRFETTVTAVRVRMHRTRKRIRARFLEER